MNNKAKDNRVASVLSGALVAIVLAGPTVRAAPATPLSNQDVIRLVKSGVPESVILSAIQAGPDEFDSSVDALIVLQKAGVSRRIMDAMMAARSGAPAPAAAAAGTPLVAPPPSAPGTMTPAALPAGGSPPIFAGAGPSTGPALTISGPALAGAPIGAASPASVAVAGAAAAASDAGEPSVVLLAPGNVAPANAGRIALERTQLLEAKTMPESMTSLAADSALQTGVATATNEMAMRATSAGASTALSQVGALVSNLLSRRPPKVTYVWALPGVSSATVLNSSAPRFAVDFSTVPGIRPEDFEPAIVKLTPSQNSWRLVGATQGREDAGSNSIADWQVYSGFLEDRVAVSTHATGAGRYDLSPSASLLPGEYSVVLRPVSKSKKFSGGDVARNQGDGMLFDSAWPFRVQADASH